MAKDPAFLFYSSDFLTETLLMTNEQVGKFIRLLCLQHQSGHLHENDMLYICQSYDERIFSKFVKDDAGKYFNERLESVILKRKAYSLSRSANRLSTQKQSDVVEDDTSKSYVKHMENENENSKCNKKIKDENEKKIENPVYVSCMASYFDFIKKKTGVPPKINGAEGKAMKELSSYLQSIVTDKADQQATSKALEYIFGHWDSIEPFLQGQIKLTQINSNIVNILNQIKNGKPAKSKTFEQQLADNYRVAGIDTSQL